MSVHLTKLDRELREVREVKVTIRRLRNGRYGKRVECNAASDEDDCGRIRWCAVAFATRRGRHHATLASNKIDKGLQWPLSIRSTRYHADGRSVSRTRGPLKNGPCPVSPVSRPENNLTKAPITQAPLSDEKGFERL